MKRFIYAQMAIRNGFMIAIGKEQPLIKFTIEADPPSVYWVYRIKSSKIEDLPTKLGLPSQFKLAPIKCLVTDEPEYLMALNVYRVSGLASGIRAEWSVFIKDENDKSRYMIVDARSSKYSMDPISIITRSSTVIHERVEDKIATQIGDGENAFVSTITHPDAVSAVKTSNEWISANDHIYWGNGISDRAFYNAGLADAKELRVSNGNFIIKDETFWGTLVEPEPVHILIVDNPIEFVITPWENVDHAKTQ